MVITGAVYRLIDVVAVAVQPLISVTCTEYVPIFALVTDAIVGFAAVEVNPAGPDHE